MPKPKKDNTQVKTWLAKSWVQWMFAFIFFFLLSWLFMGNALNDCSTTTLALGSDSTGGFGWIQWAAGNDLTWGSTHMSNYPYGETLGKPQFITSTIFIGLYKLFSTLSTPICGLNLLILFGYMSTALLMFGLIKWLIRRPEIAVFAGFAAAFVPYHQLKTQSHINYIYSGIFIAIIWAYLWFISNPSYKRAIFLSVVTVAGFYFDGYYILMSALVFGTLIASSYAMDLVRALKNRSESKRIAKQSLIRLKYLAVTIVLLAFMLIPILIVYKNNGESIKQSLATVRSDITAETLTYGSKPIEYILPSYNHAFMPSSYPSWKATKLHGSNFSETNTYIGFTLILLALASMTFLFSPKHRRMQFRGASYTELIATSSFVVFSCFMLSLPPFVTIFGHNFQTPVSILVEFTANWRVLARLFLAMHPAIVILASLGIFMLTRNLSIKGRLILISILSIILFLEFMPKPLHPAGDIYKDAPPIYKQLRRDSSVNLVAEYPLADFTYTPEIFTYQPIHNKTLVNANDGSITRGPFHASIAGLNDAQTLGALEKLGVDLIITHGMQSHNQNLAINYNPEPRRNSDGTVNILATAYAYKMNDNIPARNFVLTLKKGYESLSVDDHQISHRFITNEGVMDVLPINSYPEAKYYNISFAISSACKTDAQVEIRQDNQKLWSGSVRKVPDRVGLLVKNTDFAIKTTRCSIDVTNMSVDSAL